MQNKNYYITMLGTGNALATRCYNTCFTLHSCGGTVLMVDAGGGNGVLTQLELAGMRCEDIHDLFVPHAHTDHFLGCIWMMRMALQFHHSLHVWSHQKVLHLLTDICRPAANGYASDAWRQKTSGRIHHRPRYAEVSELCGIYPIRHGARDRDTAFPIPVNFATKLQNAGKDVDFLLAWNRPHSGDYALDELFLWIAKITK